MIKLVHTSDWHSGKSTLGESRREDLAYALLQLEGFVREQKVDCVLVCGDVFDKATVSPLDMAVVLNFFVSIKSYGAKSIIITGNHDSRDFFAGLKRILEEIGVYVFDRVQRPSDAFIELSFSEGERLTFFAFPYLSPSIPADILRSFEVGSTAREYVDFVREYLKVASSYVRTPAVMLSHIAISEAKLSGTEKEVSVKEEFCVPHTAIPSEFMYCALGHIHKHQRISDTRRIYYSGSLYQLDFGEEHDTQKGFYFTVIKDNRLDREPEIIYVPLKRTLKTYKFDLSKDSLGSMINMLTRDRQETLKRVFVVYDEKDKAMIPEYSSKIKAVDGVVYVDFEERKRVTESGEFFGERSEDLDLISLYERFYVEMKGNDINMFREKIRPVVLSILEESRRSGEV